MQRSELFGQHLSLANALRVIDNIPTYQSAEKQPFEFPPTCGSWWHSVKGQSSFVLRSITPSPNGIPQQSIKMDELCMSASSGGIDGACKSTIIRSLSVVCLRPSVSAHTYLNVIVRITFTCVWGVEVGVCKICFKLDGAAHCAHVSILKTGITLCTLGCFQVRAYIL